MQGGLVSEQDAVASLPAEGRAGIPSSESVVDTDRLRLLDDRF